MAKLESEKEGNKLPKRSHPKYEEIKNFAPYELTHCVVYEMAMRNEEVINILSKLDYIEKLKERYPYLTLASDKLFDATVEEQKKYKEISSYSLKKMKDELEKLIDKIKARNYQKDWFDKFENSNDAKNMDYSQIHKYIYGNVNVEDDNTKLCAGFLRIMVTELQNDLVHNYFIYPDGYIMNFQGAAEEYLHEVINKELDQIGTTFVDGINESVNKGFFVLQEMYKHNQTYAINQIIPNFKRKIHDPNQIITLLNFSLPVNELEEYVKHIKKALKGNDVRIIKSSIELLGKELDKDMEAKGLLKKPTASKMADLLFIYDYITARRVDIEVYNTKIMIEEPLANLNPKSSNNQHRFQNLS